MIVYLLHFTIRTDGTLFFTIYYVTGTGKTYFVRWLIKFAVGYTFFTPATESIGTYSIEIECTH